MNTKLFPVCFFVVTIITILALPGFGQQVNPDGSFSYSYPLDLPPGVNGMAPNIGLTYNSNGGNGFLGVGWSLSGLSVITRDSSYPINFDETDHYLLDGERLIPDENVPGFYHTEREGFLWIRAFDLNSSISYWEVMRKNGTKMLYGYDWSYPEIDGHIDAVGKNGKALLWALRRVEDVHGNYYGIEYVKDLINGDYYPRRIHWTSNKYDLTHAINKIYLSYEARNDSLDIYVPTRLNIDKRLKWITLMLGDNMVRKYRLDYEYNSYDDTILAPTRSRLISIQQYGSNGDQPPSPYVNSSSYTGTGDTLPAVRFNWKSNGDKEIVSFDITTSGERFTGDVNGDGKKDLIYIRVIDYETFITVLTYDGSTLTPLIEDRLLGTYFEGLRKYFIGDVNGDGNDDIIELIRDDNKSYVTVMDFHYLAGGGGIFWPHGQQMIGQSFSGTVKHFTGDFNGDGRCDIVELRRWDNKSYITLELAEGFGFESQGEERIGKSFSGLVEHYIADVNGDGRSDIIELRRWHSLSCITTELSDGESFSPQTEETIGKEFNGDNIRQYFADINGDGKSDAVQIRYHKRLINRDEDRLPVLIMYTAHIGIEYSDGCKFVSGPAEIIGDEYESMVEYSFGDFNGDGFEEIMRLANPQIADIDGDGGVEIVNYFHPITLTFYNKAGCDVIESITNGQGAVTTINYTPAPQVSGALVWRIHYPWIKNKSPRLLVTQISVNDGLNTISSTSYGYHDGVLHTGKPDEKASLGFETITTTNDATGSYTETGYYINDPDLRGLVKRQAVYDSGGAIQTEQCFEYGKMTIQEATGTHHAVTFVYKTNDYTIDFSGSETADTYWVQYTDYDGYGNLLEIVNHGNTAVTADDVRVVTEYAINTAAWIHVPKTMKKHSRNFGGTEAVASESEFYYDDSETLGTIGEKGLLTKTRRKVKESEWIEQRYHYNDYGMIVWIKDNLAINGGYTTQEFEYDSLYKGLVASTENALDMTESMEYDSLMRLVTITDYDNIAWHAAYDVFGRTVRTWGPDESETTPGRETQYVDAVLDTDGSIMTPRCIVSRTRDNAAGSPASYLESRTYYDGLGRVIQAKTESRSSTWRTTDYYYDENGHNYKTSVVYETDTPDYDRGEASPEPPYIENTYDDLGRLVTAANTDTTENHTIYEKRRTVYIDELGRASSREVDVDTTNNMISLVSKTYEGTYIGSYPDTSVSPYSSATIQSMRGETRITDQDGSRITTLLDMLGRKTSYADPDMGTWTYTYDKNSNLTSQTDAKGQVINFVYDKLNRVKYKNYGETTNTTYLYDGKMADGTTDDPENHGYCTGMLTKIVYSSGAGSETGRDSFIYDSRGRITAASKTIGSETRTVHLAYDALDRVVTETYPDNEVVTYAYAEDGSLKSVTGNRSGTIIDYATTITYTAQGKLDELTCGNGVHTKYDYYDEEGEGDAENGGRAHSFRLKSIDIENAAGKLIAGTVYNYDAVDNIKKKTFTQDPDFGPGFTETFTYDDLDRLTGAVTDGLYDDKTYDYFANNNFDTKEGREYNYDFMIGGKKLPHAVSKITDGDDHTLYTYEYDANGNMTRAEGHTTITVTAKAGSATTESPRMELWLSGKKEMSWIVADTDYRQFKWHGRWDGTSTIDILYTNDECGTSINVEKIVVNNEVFFPSPNATFDRGPYWQGCLDDYDVIPGQINMDVEGALRFTATGAESLDRTIFYDTENRIESITENGSTSTFYYDAGGNRIRKTENGVNTYYFFSTYEEEVTAGVTTKISYYFANGQRIAQRTNNGTEDELLYIHTDHLGSAVRLTDTSGEPVKSILYEPFGKTIYMAGTKRTAYQFTDQEYDGGTGLYYYGARYYDPEIGRFIQADTVLDGLNRYAYCHNNPVMYVDPTGMTDVESIPAGCQGWAATLAPGDQIVSTSYTQITVTTGPSLMPTSVTETSIKTVTTTTVGGQQVQDIYVRTETTIRGYESNWSFSAERQIYTNIETNFGRTYSYSVVTGDFSYNNTGGNTSPNYSSTFNGSPSESNGNDRSSGGNPVLNFLKDARDWMNRNSSSIMTIISGSFKVWMGYEIGKWGTTLGLAVGIGSEGTLSWLGAGIIGGSIALGTAACIDGAMDITNGINTIISQNSGGSDGDGGENTDYGPYGESPFSENIHPTEEGKKIDMHKHIDKKKFIKDIEGDTDEIIRKLFGE